jgi:hypothetical protein
MVGRRVDRRRRRVGGSRRVAASARRADRRAARPRQPSCLRVRQAWVGGEGGAARRLPPIRGHRGRITSHAESASLRRPSTICMPRMPSQCSCSDQATRAACRKARRGGRSRWTARRSSSSTSTSRRGSTPPSCRSVTERGVSSDRSPRRCWPGLESSWRPSSTPRVSSAAPAMRTRRIDSEPPQPETRPRASAPRALRSRAVVPLCSAALASSGRRTGSSFRPWPESSDLTSTPESAPPTAGALRTAKLRPLLSPQRGRGDPQPFVEAPDEPRRARWARP